MQELDISAQAPDTQPARLREYLPYAAASPAGQGPSVLGTGAFQRPGVSPAAPRSLLAALDAAADRSAVSIADGTRQAPEEVRSQLNQVVKWLGDSIRRDSNLELNNNAPVIARDYVAIFRQNLLIELGTVSDLDAAQVVRALLKLEEAADTWKRTDRGKFISRLTGSDCADAVVAIAHDIRSPLCSILLLVDSLRRTEVAGADSSRERQLGLIYGAALGLSTTVSNLIVAARGEGLVRGEPSAFSVTDIMQAVSNIVQPMCEEKMVPLNLTFPRLDARTGHASAIQQALLNLTSNALRYTDYGSVSLSCVEVSDVLVEFAVEDTGPGIPDEVLERLCYGFPPEGVPLRFSSAGLGLAIVRTLVEAMGSTLQVDTGSEGTRFSFMVELPPLR